MRLGTQVSYPETFRGIKWKRIGTVVEVGSGPKAGRVRVLWSEWVYDSGHRESDNKRTWVAAGKLCVIPMTNLFEVVGETTV